MKEIPLRDWGNLRRDGKYHLEEIPLSTPGNKIAVVFREEPDAFPVAVRVVKEFKGRPDGSHFALDGNLYSESSAPQLCLDIRSAGALWGFLYIPRDARPYEEALAEIEAEAAEEAKDVPLLDWGDLDPGFRYHLEVQMLPDPERFAVLFRKVKLGAVEGVRLVDRGEKGHVARNKDFICNPGCVTVDTAFGANKLCLDFKDGTPNYPYRMVSKDAPALEEARAGWAAERSKEAPETTKDHQSESATTSTQNHPVNVPLCDWGALNRGKAYDLERHDISERELAVVFRERGSGDVVAVRVVDPRSHLQYAVAVELGDSMRFDPATLDVDFFRQNEGLVTCRDVSLDAPSLTQLAMRNQLPDPKDETRWAYTKSELLPEFGEDQKIAGLNVAHVVEDEDQRMDLETVGEALAEKLGEAVRGLWEEKLREYLGDSAGVVVDKLVELERLIKEQRKSRPSKRSTVHGDVHVEGIPAEWNGAISSVHGNVTVTQKPTDLDAVKDIVEAVVHESTMDNSRSAANLQQHLCRIENTQAAMESELLKVSNFLTSLQESSVGLAGAMQDMADSGAALCDTVGARLSPIEATAGGVQSNQEALAKLSSDIESFLGEVREQIVHLEEKIEDVQDAVWYRQADAWPDEEAVAQLRAEHPAALHFPVWQAYRIESSGGPHNTRVIDLSTGEEIKAKSVTWSVDANRLPTARIEVYNAALSVDLPKDQVELHELPLPSGYPVLEGSKEEATPNVIPEPDAAVNKSRFFSMEWRSDSQAKASGRGAMWLMAALLFGALIGGMLMNMFPLWRSASSGLSSWSAPAPSPRPAPAPSIQAKAAFPAKQEKSSSLLCR